MRHLWSETHRRRLMRRVWVALAEAQHEAGLVSEEQLDDLRTHVDDVDIERTSAIENEIQHDLMAELRTFAEQCQSGGSVLHMGATSTDILDNVDVLRVRSGMELLCIQMRGLCEKMADLIEFWSDTPVLGFTHLQPAEPVSYTHLRAHET